MEERKRRKATAVAISKFREEHPSYSDEHIANLVEKTCPGIYDNDIETAVEVVKELYREQEDWTDENFARLLKEMTKQNRLISYTKEEKHRLLIEEKTKDLIEYIYKEAPNRDFHLSDCQEWNDPDVRKHFNERYAYNDRTLAQTFFTLLNQKTLYEKICLVVSCCRSIATQSQMETSSLPEHAEMHQIVNPVADACLLFYFLY